MKRFMLILLALIYWVNPIQASPWLECDVYSPPGNGQCLPDQFLVELNNGGWIESNACPINGSVKLHYDLATLAPGTYTLQVAAYCSIPDVGSPETKMIHIRKTKLTAKAYQYCYQYPKGKYLVWKCFRVNLR